MKQHISETQLQELTEDGKKRLREWWTPKEFDVYFDGGESNTWENDQDGCVIFNYERKQTAFGGDEESQWRDAYPLLSIGQLIEYLESNSNPNDIFGYYLQITQLSRVWRTEWKQVNVSVYPPRNIDSKELIDCLWEATKELLEKETL